MMEFVLMMMAGTLCVIGLYATIEFFRKGLNEMLQDQFGVDTLDEYREKMMLTNN